MHASHCYQIALRPETRLGCFQSRQSCYLLIHDGESLMFDLHEAMSPRLIAQCEMPQPQQVIHTHIQTEHCGKPGMFDHLPRVVPDALELVARDPQAVYDAAKTTWDDPSAWMETFGREPFGIAGAMTYRPPALPLSITRTVEAGEKWHWHDMQLRAIALPGHMLESLGYVLSVAGEDHAFFCGDLLQSPGVLVNLFDLEIAYGRTCLATLPALLRQVADEVNCDLWLPTTGPAMHNGRTAAKNLAYHLEQHFDALEWQPDNEHVTPAPKLADVGRFEKVHEGIYQMQKPMNTIVFIDAEGEGLMIDPGPCDYENPNRVQDFMADVEALEREAGLKNLSQILITHMHGDHYDMTPHVLERYPDCRVGAWAPLARLMEDPSRYPYACLMPWYKLGWDRLAVQDRLTRQSPFRWRDVRIQTVHLPGHCLIHAGYLFTFNGLNIAVAGDAVQTGGESTSVQYIMCNHSAPDLMHGIPRTIQTLASHHIDLNLGGHGTRFKNANAMYRASQQRLDHALPTLQAIVPDGDLATACIRPEYPDASTLLDDASSADV